MSDDESARKIFKQPTLADVWPYAVALPAHEQRALAIWVRHFLHKAKQRENWSSDAWPALRLIRLVFLVDWDPIGVFHHSGTDDEYERYVPGFYELLRGGAAEENLCDYLRDIETVAMGMKPNEPYFSQRAARRQEAVRKIQTRYALLEADKE